MSISTSPELFINMKRIPDSSSDEYQAFFLNELHKIRYGVTIGGVYMHGWLYWHLNHWNINLDIEDQFNHDIIRKFTTPDFRDNEWVISEHIKRAEDEKKGLLIFGSRRLGKSEFEASWLGRGATIYEGSENVLAGTNEPDIKVLASKLDKGLAGLHPFFRFDRLQDDWRKEVSLGYKAKRSGGKRYEHSKIWIRNLDEGKNTEAIAGTTPKTLVIDEIGKHNWLEGFAAAIPGFTSPFGWRCVPIAVGCVCAGTKVWTNSGNLVNIEDLKKDEGIIGFSGIGISKEEITYWQPPKETDCFRIETNKGTSLECSYNHPILYKSRDEHKMIPLGNGKRRSERKIYFKEAQDLEAGDQIALIEEVPIFGNREMWEARLVGWLVGDGSYGFDKTPVLSNCDKSINDYIENNFETTTEKEYLTKEGKTYKETRIRKICPALRQLGIYGQSKSKKTLPVDIHSYRLEDICEFLGGFFDTDGSVPVIGSKSVPVIQLSSAYRNLLFEVKLLLQKLGIHSNIFFKKPNSNNRLDREGHYDLCIRDGKSILKFYSLIQFSVEYKQKNLEAAILWLQNKKYKIPKEIKGLRFERIVKVEYIGLKPVYNLTAGTTNTYVANGIVTHNTGGTFKPNSDAQKVFENPDTFNFLALEWPGKVKKIGLFFPGTMRMEGKVKTTFGSYLERKSGILVPESSELHDLPFYESDKDKAQAATDLEMEQFGKSDDPKVLLKARMYYPDQPEDCFLSDETNDFPLNAIQEHLKYLDQLEKEQGFVGEAVELYRDAEGKVKFTAHTKLKEIRDYPVTQATIKDAPIIMYERPVDNPAAFLYIGGADPYNQNTSATSPSLGTVHIYKRMYDPVSGTFQNMIVASFASRPHRMRDWHTTVEMLLELYGATLMIENAGTNFIEYMDGKNKGYLLADGYNLLRQISPNTGIRDRVKGLPATPQVINHSMNLLYDYCNEEILGVGTDGTAIMKLGVTRIRDRMLLIEMLNYTSSGGNYDRIVSFRHALTYDQHLQKTNPIVNYEENPEPPKPHKTPPRSPFSRSSNPFGGRSNSMFK